MNLGGTVGLSFRETRTGKVLLFFSKPGSHGEGKGEKRSNSEKNYSPACRIITLWGGVS